MTRCPQGVYLVLDPRVCHAAGNDPLAVAGAAARAGVGAIQVRVKDSGPLGQEALDLVVAVARDLATVVQPPLLLVNDRVDVALAARAAGAGVDGVHLGAEDMEPGEARRLLGPEALLGLSAGAARPRSGVVDHVGVGPVRRTATKPDADDPVGWDGLARAVAAERARGLPVVAIGGLTAGDCGAVRSAGADAIAVVSALCAATDPGRAADHAVQAWWAAAPGEEAAR